MNKLVKFRLARPAQQVLFRASVQIDTRNEKGKMPLHLAAENGHLK